MTGRWAVLLDRDGTLVRNAHHPVRAEELVPYAGMAGALAALAAGGARLILVSNQSAVARGLLDEPGLRRLDRRLRALAGTPFAGTYYCPHHPDFTGPCSCRKPAPGLLRRGLRATGVRARDAYFVGDSRSDLEAARAAGVRAVLVLTGYGRSVRSEALRRGLAAHVARDVRGAARWILRDRKRAISGRSGAGSR